MPVRAGVRRGQMHVYMWLPSTHEPPLRHGLLAHSAPSEHTSHSNYVTIRFQQLIDLSSLPTLRRICFRRCLFVCLSVCLSVCLLATLRKNFWADLHEIFTEDRQWANEPMIKFWWRYGSHISTSFARHSSFDVGTNRAMVNIVFIYLQPRISNTESCCDIAISSRYF